MAEILSSDLLGDVVHSQFANLDHIEFCSMEDATFQFNFPPGLQRIRLPSSFRWKRVWIGSTDDQTHVVPKLNLNSLGNLLLTQV